MADHKIIKECLPERDVALICYWGSQHFNLDKENSDKDFFVFTFPTKQDVESKYFYRSKKKFNDCDYSYRDIRNLRSSLDEPDFIDMLFSSLTYDKSIVELHEVVTMRKDISTMNLPRFYQCAIEKHKLDIKNLYDGKPEIIDKYGYNISNAAHSYRILDLTERFAVGGFKNLRKASYYENDDNNRKLLLDIKNGNFNIDQINQILSHKLDFVDNNIKEIYLSQKANINIINKLKYLLETLVSINIQIKGG